MTNSSSLDTRERIESNLKGAEGKSNAENPKPEEQAKATDVRDQKLADTTEKGRRRRRRTKKKKGVPEQKNDVAQELQPKEEPELEPDVQLILKENPYVIISHKRVRALRKRMDRIERVEKALAEGLKINVDQKAALASKSTVQSLLAEIEKLHNMIFTHAIDAEKKRLKDSQVSVDVDPQEGDEQKKTEEPELKTTIVEHKTVQTTEPEVSAQDHLSIALDILSAGTILEKQQLGDVKDRFPQEYKITVEELQCIVDICKMLKNPHEKLEASAKIMEMAIKSSNIIRDGITYARLVEILPHSLNIPEPPQEQKQEQKQEITFDFMCPSQVYPDLNADDPVAAPVAPTTTLVQGPSPSVSLPAGQVRAPTRGPAAGVVSRPPPGYAPAPNEGRGSGQDPAIGINSAFGISTSPPPQAAVVAPAMKPSSQQSHQPALPQVEVKTNIQIGSKRRGPKGPVMMPTAGPTPTKPSDRGPMVTKSKHNGRGVYNGHGRRMRGRGRSRNGFQNGPRRQYRHKNNVNGMANFPPNQYTIPTHHHHQYPNAQYSVNHQIPHQYHSNASHQQNPMPRMN